MKPVSEIDALRRQGILSSLAGAPFLLVFGLVWIAAASSSYWVPRDIAPWIYLILGAPAMPVALALERRVGYVRAVQRDVLLPLTLQIVFVQIVAFPAILLVWDATPEYVPVAFAAVVGAHFLPFQWVYRTRLYGYLGVVVAVGPFVLAVCFGREALHYTGFFVGPALLAGAFIARSHARATWLEAGPAADRDEAAWIEARHGAHSISTDPSRLDLGAIHAYLTRSYWAEGISQERVAASLEGSLCFGLFDADERQVGFARVVTDRATFAYLCDVYVLETHRGHGLGKWLIEVVMRHPALQDVRRFMLVTKDAHGLYSRFGFSALPAPERFMEVFRADIYRPSRSS